jgi:hypothetical protein
MRASEHPVIPLRCDSVSWEEVAGGLLVGLAAVVVWEVGRWLWRWIRLRREFGDLAGIYVVTRKLNPSAREDGIAHIDVSGSRLTVTFRDLKAGESISGEIGMNESMPRNGRGQYHHLDGGDEMWGFWDVQVVPPKSLLVHTTYAHDREHHAVVSGFVWTRR